MKYLGCAYYPEYWGCERFETDARLMQEAGINVVRIGEFAWCKMEPEEGVYTLDWLHQCITNMSKYGIHVVLCTPTATPPAWLTTKYPDTLLMKSDGKRMSHGMRRHYCYTSDTYRHYSARIVEKLSTEFAGYKNIIAWQIDNEPDFGETGICHCDTCQKEFQSWLAEKYGSIAELNRNWGTGFWSMDYNDFQQVQLADLNLFQLPSRKLDTRRFASAMLSRYILEQAAILRRNHAQAIISTNLNGGVLTNIDYNRLFSSLDLAFKDLYFDAGTMDIDVFTLNQCKSFKPGHPFWITETNVSALSNGHPPHRDQWKAWMWSSYAHGSDAYMVFRWRTCLSGQEQELQGMLEHSGLPGHRYRNVKEGFEEIGQWTAKLGELPLPDADVALLYDYDLLWGYQSSTAGREINYEKYLFYVYKELYGRSVPTDVISTDKDIGGYKLVVVPTPMVITADFAQKLKAYITNGGIVLIQGQAGMRDGNGNYLPYRGPDHLQDILGVYLNGGMYLYSQIGPDESRYHPETKTTHVEVKLTGALGHNPVSGTAGTWIGDVELNGAKTLLSFTEDQYENQPAIVEKETGKGATIYAAAQKLDPSLTERLFDYVLEKAGVKYFKDLPAHVEILYRGNVTFIINHRNECVSLEFPGSYSVLKGTVEDRRILLKPFDVCLLQTPSKPSS